MEWFYRELLLLVISSRVPACCQSLEETLCAALSFDVRDGVEIDTLLASRM